jgi:tRNA G18 (ribose-2'-O)-methylase SpoU
MDAVLVTPACADPWYRRAVRVSMGAVFALPWARLPEWPQGIELLQRHGFSVIAMALTDSATTLNELAAHPPQKFALLLGAEGHGLNRRTIQLADSCMKIPMSHGVDSLNVAAAAAVAFWGLTNR